MQYSETSINGAFVVKSIRMSFKPTGVPKDKCERRKTSHLNGAK